MMIDYQSIPLPVNDTNPWIWFTGIAALAITFLFRALDSAKNETISRCEGREDKLTEENKVCLSTTKDLLVSVLKAVEISESAIELHRQTDLKIEANKSIMEESKRISSDILKSIEEMRRSR